MAPLAPVTPTVMIWPCVWVMAIRRTIESRQPLSPKSRRAPSRKPIAAPALYGLTSSTPLRRGIMDERDIRKWLENVRRGHVTIDSAVEQLRQLPYEDLGFAKIHHHRTLRQEYPEVIYGRGKTPQQVTGIVRGMLRANASHNILITRADRKMLAAVKR